MASEAINAMNKASGKEQSMYKQLPQQFYLAKIHAPPPRQSMQNDARWGIASMMATNFERFNRVKSSHFV